jgi:hypothetical protein
VKTAEPCPACKAAETDRHSGFIRAGCRGCEVRELARSPAFFEASRQARITTRYRAALRAVFGDDIETGHALVKAEHRRIYAP